MSKSKLITVVHWSWWNLHLLISVEYRQVGGSAWGSSGSFYYISWYFHFQVKCFCSKTQDGVCFPCVYVEERKRWLGAIKQMNLRSRSLKWGPNKRACCAGLIKIGAVIPTNSNQHSNPSGDHKYIIWSQTRAVFDQDLTFRPLSENLCCFGCFVYKEQARKPRSYASSKLCRLTHWQGWSLELLA